MPEWVYCSVLTYREGKRLQKSDLQAQDWFKDVKRIFFLLVRKQVGIVYTVNRRLLCLLIWTITIQTAVVTRCWCFYSNICLRTALELHGEPIHWHETSNLFVSADRFSFYASAWAYGNLTWVKPCLGNNTTLSWHKLNNHHSTDK